MWKFPAPWKIISLLQIGGKSDYKWRKNFHRKNRQTSENYFKAIPWLSNTQKETQTRARCAHQVWCGGYAFRIYCESFCRFTNFNRISLSINFVTFDCHLSMASIPNCLHFHVFFFSLSLDSMYRFVRSSVILSLCLNVQMCFSYLFLYQSVYIQVSLIWMCTRSDCPTVENWKVSFGCNRIEYNSNSLWGGGWKHTHKQSRIDFAIY